MLCKYKSLRNAYFLPGISNKMMVPQPPARGSTNFAQLQITKYFINGTCTDIAINGISKIAQKRMQKYGISHINKGYQ